jgi:ferrochelatase
VERIDEAHARHATRRREPAPHRVDVAAPGFVADCLETLEELAIEGERQFRQAGGGDYNVIPCLNESGRWMDALADLTSVNLQGWLAPPPSAAERETTLLRAKALGANK